MQDCIEKLVQTTLCCQYSESKKYLVTMDHGTIQSIEKTIQKHMCDLTHYMDAPSPSMGW